MRSRFDEQLALLNKEMIEMGALCEEVIALASKALTEADPELAKKVAPLDAEIDQKERNIESLCLKLLLQLFIRMLAQLFAEVLLLLQPFSVCNRGGFSQHCSSGQQKHDHKQIH